ncbi:MAG: DUF1501 domain-containing protein [Akkermansiaceae bacterium]
MKTQPKSDRTLVVVFLRGGADGLTLTPPVGNQKYYDVRPNLAVPENEVLKLGDANFGLNPGMSGLHDIFKDGGLAVAPAVGSDDTTRSHFYAQDLMEHGGMVAGGWLGRFLRYRDGGNPTALSAIALNTSMPEVLRGAPAATVMESMDAFSLGENAQSFQAELGKLYRNDPTLLGTAARDTLQALDRIAELTKSSYTPRNGVKYDDFRFATRLKQAAQLIRARVGVEAISLDLGGWDSHFGQSPLITPMIAQLSKGLTSFYRDLGPLMEKVTVVVMTEFGRRVAENSSFGTDHGRGGSMFILSAGNGGTLGTMPELKTGVLVGPGDVPVETDYRTALQPILNKHGAGNAMAKIFPGYA